MLHTAQPSQAALSFFDSLPPEMSGYLFSFFKYTDIALMSSTNKDNYLIHMPPLWKEEMRVHFFDKYDRLFYKENVNWKKEFRKHYLNRIASLEGDLKKLYFIVSDGQLSLLLPHAETLKKLISVNHYFYELMFLAASKNHQEILDFFYGMIECIYEEDRDKQRNRALRVDKFGANIFHAAVICNKSLETIKALHAANIDGDVFDGDGSTATALAAQLGRTDLFAWLVTITSVMVLPRDDIEANAGETLLHIASRCGHLAIVKQLCEQAFDINRLDDYGCTALDYATNNNGIEIVQYLLGRNAMVREDEYHFIRDCRDTAILALLNARGADVNAVGKKNIPLIVHATKYGYVNLVKFLVLCGVNVNAADKDGNTALLEVFAAGFSLSSNSAIALFKALLNAEADVKKVNGKGYQAIYYVVKNGAHHLLDLLLPYYDSNELNAPFGPGDMGGSLLLNVAARGERNYSLYGKDKKYSKTIKKLLQHGVNFYAHDVNTSHVYGNAIQSEKNQIILDTLLAYEEELSLRHGKETPKLGHRFLAMYAITHDEPFLLPILQRNGFDINSVNESGQSLLMQASKRAPKLACKILEQDDVDIGIVDSSKHTALYYAWDGRKKMIADVLLNRMLKTPNPVTLDPWLVEDILEGASTEWLQLFFNYEMIKLDKFIIFSRSNDVNPELASLLVKFKSIIAAESPKVASSATETFFGWRKILKSVFVVNAALASVTPVSMQECIDYADSIDGLSEKKFSRNPIIGDISRNVVRLFHIRTQLSQSLIDISTVLKVSSQYHRVRGMVKQFKENNVDIKQLLIDACKLAAQEKEIIFNQTTAPRSPIGFFKATYDVTKAFARGLLSERVINELEEDKIKPLEALKQLLALPIGQNSQHSFKYKLLVNLFGRKPGDEEGRICIEESDVGMAGELMDYFIKVIDIETDKQTYSSSPSLV